MKRGLGVGMDLPWRGPYGIVDGRVSARTQQFFQRHGHRFSTLFVSWQPNGKGVPDLADLTAAWDPFLAQVNIPNRTLHQTALNLAGGNYDRTAIIDVTNRLIDRYQMQWVNEDLGSWSVNGRPLPYPQPPPLTPSGVAHCADVCARVDGALNAPLVVEFPGFETPSPWLFGELDAYDAFKRIVDSANVLCTLDTGHLLTWRWLQGHRGAALLEGLDRLPLDRCIEVHCSGTIPTNGRLIDAHHGVLVDAQLELASRLMARCPNLRVVTYEDPKYNDEGILPLAAQESLDQLSARVDQWMAQPEQSTVPTVAVPSPLAQTDAPWEDELQSAFIRDTAFGRRCRAQILSRTARGIGKLTDLYPNAIADWKTKHPKDVKLDGLLVAFLASAAGETWSEFAWAVGGRCIEDAFGRFLSPGSAEHLHACARVLTVYPNPPFQIPDGFRPAPLGWFTVADLDEPHLYASLGGRLVCGAITPLLVHLLNGQRPEASEPALAKLTQLGLLSAAL